MDAETLLNPFVALYLLSVIAVYAGFAWWRRQQAAAVQARRRGAGLDEEVLLGSAVRLDRFQAAAATEALVLAAAVVVLPLVWWGVARAFDTAAAGGLALAFAALFLWVLLTATDVGKAFFGGLAFRLLAAYHPPFQVGDRVTLGGHAGKALEIGVFHVRLQTADDDLVSVPTASLWSAPLVSANAGDRASLCVIRVYLDPLVRAEQWREAENRLWGAMHASLYLDVAKPRQIYFEQTPQAIVLTAKAYVASTYNEPLFKSDVTRAFLEAADELKLPLARPALPAAG